MSMKKKIILLICLAVSGFLCMHPAYSQSSVIINSLDPDSGPPETTVRITGEGFLPVHDTVMFVSVEHSGYFTMTAASFIDEIPLCLQFPRALILPAIMIRTPVKHRI